MPAGQVFSSDEIRSLSVMNTILHVSVVADGTQNISSYRFFFFSIAKELRQSTINPVNEALKITVCPLGDKTVTNPIFLAGRDPDFLVTSGDGGPCITDEALCSVLSVTSFSAFV